MSSQWTTPTPTPDPTPPPPKRRHLMRNVILPLVAGMIVLGWLASLSGDDSSKTGSSSGSAVSMPNTVAEPVATRGPAAAPATPAAPKPSDFALRVKTIEKQCFGSAGCNVVYRVELAYNGPTLDPDTTYEVTYEVRGPEDGAQVGTLEVTGTKYTEPDEVVASTSSASTRLKATVTEVAEQ